MNVENNSSATEMFDDLYKKFGTNFFLTMFLVMLFAAGYFFMKYDNCESSSSEQVKEAATQRAADKQEFVNYLIQKEQRAAEIQQKADEAKREAQANESSLRQFKNDLK
jgi:uncharacterized protein HemX